MTNKRFIADVLLSIIANTVPLLIIQLIALPIVGAELGDVQYGLIVTLLSLFTILSFSFGNVLNNIRLLVNNDYKQKEITGDFNILLLGSIIISSFLVMLGTIYYEGSFSFVSIVLIIIITCSKLLMEYLKVSFRINLNYKAILISNIFLGVGYIFGITAFYLTGYWQFIFIFGIGFSLFYIIKNTDLLKEGFIITKLFKVTTYKSVMLFCSVFLNHILSYADKLLLFPLMGPSTVSVYYTATILGKMIMIIIGPTTNVILSYLVRMKTNQNINFKYMLITTSIVGVIGYFVIILISPTVLNILYPNWAAESLELIKITTASAILSVIISLINPFLLRFININWQLIISGVNVVVYITSVFIFYRFYGLIGFCIGILVARFFKFVLKILIYIFNKDTANSAADKNFYSDSA